MTSDRGSITVSVMNRTVMMLACLSLGTCSVGACSGGDSADGPDSGVGNATPDAQSVAQSWTISSDVSINGKNLSNDSRSAITRVMDLGNGPVTVVQVTTAENYCELLKNDGCLENGEVLLSFQIYGNEPGAYPLSSILDQDPGHMSASLVGIDLNCAGAGIGPSDGWAEVHSMDLSPGGAVEMEFLLTLIAGSVGGTIIAPWCEVDPS